eukprot:gene19872-23589_t
MDYYINNNAKVENKLSRDSVISFQIPSTSTDFTEMADENDSDLEESDMIEIQPSTSTDNIAPMKRKVEKAKWSKDEDEKLKQAVALLNGKNWKLIANYLPGKTEVQCLHRWTKVLNPNLTKGPWTAEEDQLLRDL